MIEPIPAFLDTNVIVRYLTGEPPEPSARAARIVDGDRTFLLSEVVLAEAGYVLTKVYRTPRQSAVDALMSFVQKKNIRLTRLPKALVLDALALCRHSNRYSFADVILWAEARDAGEASLLTFDEDFPSSGVHIERL